MEVSAKLRTGDPLGEPCLASASGQPGECKLTLLHLCADARDDIEQMDIWAGVIPLTKQEPLPAEASKDLQPGVAVPQYVLDYTAKAEQ